MSNAEPIIHDSRVRTVRHTPDVTMNLGDLRKFMAATAELDDTTTVRVHDVWGGSNSIAGDPWFFKGIDAVETTRYSTP